MPINSPLEESECNGRVENTIRRIQEKTRALRHAVEQGIKEKLQDDAPIMVWLVRWSAESISKYSVGDDGKSPYQRIRGSKCHTFLVPFGEAVLYLFMKTVHRSKGELAKFLGVWLGINERTEETLIGTSRGIVKCRIVSRMSEDKRWDAKMVVQMGGFPWEVVPGKQGILVPVEIREDGDVVDGRYEEEVKKIPIDEEADEDVKFKGGQDKLHISRKAIEKYGPTAGCPACTAIERRKHLTNPSGRLGANHNEICRTKNYGE